MIRKHSPVLDIFPDDQYCYIGGGSGGGGGGIEGKIYQPQNQGGLDTSWNNIFSGLENQYGAGTSPGQEWLPYAMDTGRNIYNNPYQNQAVNASQQAFLSDLSLIPQHLQDATGMRQYGQMGAPYGQIALEQGTSPAYGMAQNLGVGLSNQTLPNVPALQQAGMQDLMTGYDPQHALYNRTQSQVADQVNAQLANSGLAGSPYGASVAGNTLANFNLDWQDRQQQRQLAGGQGAAQMFGAQVGQGNAAMNDILMPAQAAGAAQQQAAGTFGSLGQSMQAGNAAARDQEMRVLQEMATYGAQPYNMMNQVYNNDFSGIQNSINLGNAQYQLPQQLLGNAQSYMQLGQSANATAAQNMLAQNQQMMNGLSGLGGLVGGLNNWGSSGSGGLLGSLFGGGASAADLEAGNVAVDASGGAGLETLLSAAGGISSDRRLKTNIKRVGTLDNGLAVYAYRYKGEMIPQIGLMADEVEKIHPEAVSVDSRGFKMVDYALAVE